MTRFLFRLKPHQQQAVLVESYYISLAKSLGVLV